MSQAIRDINYDSLSRTQKLALFLIVIGPEQAAVILRNFEETEIEKICREIANYNLIGEEVQNLVMDDFSDVITHSLDSMLGGSRFAQEALTIAKGDYKAQTLIGRIAPLGNSTEVMDELSEMDSRQIFNLIRREQPQTIAFILSYLKADKASEILMMVSPEMRDEVVERVGIMDTTTLENVNKVIRSIRRHINSKDNSSQQRSGGVRMVAELLNGIDKDISKNLLNKLEERNPALGQAIQRKMFSFDDLGTLSSRDLQRVMREIESSDLVVALKAAKESLQEVLLGAVSKRAAETLKEEMEMLGPVRLKDVEAAQDRIIQSVRALEESGEVTLETGGDDVLM